MANLPLTSREYKLILNADRFRERKAGIETFFKLIKFLAGDGTDITPLNKVERRITSYLDTPELALNRRGFAMRLREEIAPKTGLQINLKCRNSDRYISAAKDISATGDNKAKFEEDILPPFTSKFSNSSTVKMKTAPQLRSFGDAVKIFPGLKTLGLDEKAPLVTVNDFKVIEVVHDLCEIGFGNNEPVGSSMSFWYLEDSETEWPLIAEFSFSYDALPNPENKNLEDFPMEAVAGAGNLFSSLQKHSGWLNLNGTTKTAFAIEA